MKGVAPEAQGSYAGPTFRCLNGHQEVPHNAVNDDYCDCKDGSDEPGTGACAGQDATLFHCANEGGTAQLIYASRVGDGICDCCDGSDESASHCSNTCIEDGARDRRLREEKLQRLQDGLARKELIVSESVSRRKEWAAEIVRLEAELPQLEAAVDEVKKAAPVQEPLQEPAAGSQAVGEATPKEPSSEEATSEKKVVSEYAKWMDGAENTPGAIEGEVHDEDGGEKKVVSEYAKWMDGAENTPGAIEGEDIHGELEDPEGSAAVAQPPPITTDAVKEAEDKVRARKDEVARLQGKLKQLQEDKLAYGSLLDKCLEKTDSQYTYKLCFFEDARQDHTLLGRWTGWDGPKGGLFSDGYMCPGGPARELRVIFECGPDEAVLDVSEPSRCAYEAHVSHPGACEAADAAEIAKPVARHPKDEL